jgi:hypothetical protein
MQKQRLTSAIVRGDFGPGPGTKVAAVLGEDAAPRPVNAVKRPTFPVAPHRHQM